MTIQSFDFPAPENEADFESFCLAIFRERLPAPELQRYARRGQAQLGVDLLGRTESGQLCGVQCKLRNADKTLSETDVTDEVEKAKAFSPPLDKHVIATTARRDPAIQRLAAKITRAHLEQGLFSVHVYAWDDLKEVLKLNPRLARDLYGVGETAPRITAETVVVATAGAVVDLGPAPRTDFHRQIDEAFEFVGEGNPEVTVKLLDQLRRSHWDKLSDRERYRVLANIGNAWLVRNDKERAAKAYLEAATYQSSDENARAFEALAHLLLGDRERAFELADVLCKERPTLSRAQMIRIKCSPSDSSVDELLEGVPAAVRGEPEIVLALHDRALAEGRPEEAERIVRDYAKADRGWAPLTLALGGTILQRELEAMHLGLDGPILSNADRLREAADLITEGLGQIPEGDPDKQRLGAHLNRGTCFQLLGEIDRARADFREAQRVAPHEERVAIALARSAYPDRSNLNEGIGILDEYLEQNESRLVKMLLAEFLRQRQEPGDLERAATILEPLMPSLAEVEEDHRADFVEMLCDLYIRLGRSNDAAALVDGLDEELFRAGTRHAIRGNVFRQVGRAEEALAEARLVRDILDDPPDWHEARRVALLLERLERYGEAFQLWRRLVCLDSVSTEANHLLYCARQAGEDGFVMEFCREIRARGHYDRRMLSHEVETLLQYGEYSKAKEAFLEYLSVNADDKLVRLHLTTLALEHGWDDLVQNDPTALPTLEEVSSAEVGAEVVNVLRLGPDPTLAVDFAYGLWRKFPDSAAAHASLVFSVLQPGEGGLHIPTELTKVEPGAAVQWIDCDSEESHWVVIEDAPDASMARNEFHSEHPLVQAMLDKEVGDEFSFSEVGFRNRRGQVAEVRDKRIFRAQECMTQWTQRFPDRPFVEAVPVGVRGEGPTSLDDFREVIEILRRDSESRERLEGGYKSGNVPIAAFAGIVRKPVFETVGYLANSEELPVRACPGSTQGFDEVKLLVEQASSVVLEPTALATLALLEETAILDELPFRCCVTESTIQELKSAILVDSPARRAQGYMGYRDGHPTFQEVPEEEIIARLEQLKQLIDLLETKCEVIGGSDMARLPVEKRRFLMDHLARPSVESVAAASSRSVPIWTDDHLLLLLLREDLPTSHIWTQSVFLWAQSIGIVSRQRHSRTAARLFRYGYDFTSLNHETVVDTCEATGWRTDDEDLAAVLAQFGNRGWNRDGAVRVTVATVLAVWRQAELVEQARAVTIGILASLVTREDGLAIVDLLLRNVDRLMGLNVVRAKALKELLSTFLETGGALVGPQ